MKVGLDISQIAHKGGVAVYTENLSKELIKFTDLDLVFFYSSLRKPYKGSLPNVRHFRVPPTIFEILFNKIRILPIETFIGDVDVFHSSDWVQPETKAKKVTTYHDVVPLKFPQWSHPKIVAVHKRRLELVEKEVDCIIAVSESTKKDLLEISRIPEEKIRVIYEGVSDIFKPLGEKETSDFKRKTKLPDRFILSIGGIGERRNLRRVREACESLGLNIVILGETIHGLLETDLPLLYSAATVVLYPSLYEGFGLPILEAMACGTPVITSNISSMPEVGGDAAIYVDPMDIKDIEKKIKLIVEDEDKRREMIKKGFERVKLFTWQKCAEKTVAAYRKLLN